MALLLCVPTYVSRFRLDQGYFGIRQALAGRFAPVVRMLANPLIVGAIDRIMLNEAQRSGKEWCARPKWVLDSGAAALPRRGIRQRRPGRSTTPDCSGNLPRVICVMGSDGNIWSDVEAKAGAAPINRDPTRVAKCQVRKTICSTPAIATTRQYGP